MDTDFQGELNPPITEEEYYRAEEALEQMRISGSSDIVCLRCGARYVFEDHGTGYIIRCQTEGCFEVTVRGI